MITAKFPAVNNHKCPIVNGYTVHVHSIAKTPLVSYHSQMSLVK